MRNRGIGRARMFMGALLLLAAVITWGIGLMMSPHGKAVAHGTEYLRTTILIYRRNGAIGTLILAAVAAWLLFPRRWPKRPARDWSLIALLAFLVGSSFYTLIWLQPFALRTVGANESVATADIGSDAVNSAAVDENLATMTHDPNATIPVAHMKATELNAAPASQSGQLEPHDRGNVVVEEPSDRAQPDDREQSTEPQVTGEQSEAERNTGLQDGGDEPSNNETEENEE